MKTLRIFARDKTTRPPKLHGLKCTTKRELNRSQREYTRRRATSLTKRLMGGERLPMQDLDWLYKEQQRRKRRRGRTLEVIVLALSTAMLIIAITFLIINTAH